MKPFLRNYLNAHVHLYEASPRYIAMLRRKFSGDTRVTLRPVAASDEAGKVTFHETNLHGAGSLLEVGEAGRQSFGLTAAETNEVEAVRLDDDFPTQSCDCLWVDVQGAELMVLHGAKRLLNNTHSVFIEVATDADLYKGGCDFDEVTDFLKNRGFRLALLGMDGVQGNALYVRADAPAQIL